MSYVLQRLHDGAYVAPPGSAASYTRSLQLAHVFPSKEAAQRAACGNERVLPLEAAMLYGRGHAR